jgi:GT2 family glycosyltransferase
MAYEDKVSQARNKMDKKLSICIPVFNRWNFTSSALKDLSRLSDTEVIVCDNGSTDETQLQLQDSKEIVYLRNKENRGFAFASNRAYSIASAPNVLFLNNDIRVKSNFENWTTPLLEHCDTSLVGPTMGQLDRDFNFVQEANKELTGNSYISGWCVASSKKIWDRLIINGYLGPFSEEFGLAYFEDPDATMRARLLGIPFKVVEIPVVHFGKQTSSQLNTHKLYTEARKVFVKKWTRK